MTFVVVSRAPLHKIEAFKKRMGWRFKWVSSYENDFNFDYHVSFTPDQRADGKAFNNYEVRKNSQRSFPASAYSSPPSCPTESRRRRRTERR